MYICLRTRTCVQLAVQGEMTKKYKLTQYMHERETCSVVHAQDFLSCMKNKARVFSEKINGMVYNNMITSRLHGVYIIFN